MKTKWNMYQLAMVCSDLYKELKKFCYHPFLMILSCKYKHNLAIKCNFNANHRACISDGIYQCLSVSADMKKRLSVYRWGTQMYVLPRNNMVTIWNRKCFYCLIPLYDPLLFLIYLSPNYDTFRWFVRPQLVGLASPRYWDVDKDFGSGTKRSKSTREDI